MSAASSEQKARYVQSSDAASPDWAAVAAGAWEAPSWKTAAREYHEAREHSGGKPPQPPDPRLVALLGPKVSLEQAQRRLIERHESGRAATSTIEALMYALRRGGAVLTDPNNARRLSELSEAQLHGVCARLQNLKPTIARLWTAEEVEALVAIWWNTHRG
jgi:hypothetical protein